jgi:hypothetical protein
MAALSTILEVAREIMREHKGPMHVNDIAEQAVSSARNLNMTAEAFSGKLASALSAHVKTKKPVFLRVKDPKKGTNKKGVYRLKREIQQAITTRVDVPIPDKQFLGKGGEHAVMSELLFWGFNVSLMTVDYGIDVIAQKGGKFYNIQVKTASEQVGRKFLYTIKKSSFGANDNSSTFYVFVMRRKMSCVFAIIPSNQIHSLNAAGNVGGNSSFSISIHVDEKWKEFHFNWNNITQHVNNFGLIR